jgi:hypothetical protein
MSLKWPEAKDPSDISWWALDVAAFLAGDTLVTAVWTAPAGLTKVAETNTSTVAKVKFSGGTAGSTHDVVLDFTTADAQTFQRTVKLKVKEL